MYTFYNIQLLSGFISLCVYLPLIFKEYSTEQFYFFIFYNLSLIFLYQFYFSSTLSFYIYISLSPSFSFFSLYLPPSLPALPFLLFPFSTPATVHSPLTFNRQAFKHYSSGCWGPAVEHNHNTTRTQHNRTHHTHTTRNAPYSTPHFHYCPLPLPLLPCVSLSIKRNLVLISCLLLLLKFIEPILIFYLLTHAQDMAEGHKRERGTGTAAAQRQLTARKPFHTQECVCLH